MESSVYKQPERRSWAAWALAALAVLLGLVGLLAALPGGASRGPAAAPAMLLLNLFTGLASLGGALGYSLRKGWGMVVFGLSVLGHLTAHAWLLLAAFQSGRISPSSVIGLSIIPLAAVFVLAGMLWQRRRRT